MTCFGHFPKSGACSWSPGPHTGTWGHSPRVCRSTRTPRQVRGLPPPADPGHSGPRWPGFPGALSPGLRKHDKVSSRGTNLSTRPTSRRGAMKGGPDGRGTRRDLVQRLSAVQTLPPPDPSGELRYPLGSSLETGPWMERWGHTRTAKQGTRREPARPAVKSWSPTTGNTQHGPGRKENPRADQWQQMRSPDRATRGRDVADLAGRGREDGLCHKGAESDRISTLGGGGEGGPRPQPHVGWDAEIGSRQTADAHGRGELAELSKHPLS